MKLVVVALLLSLGKAGMGRKELSVGPESADLQRRRIVRLRQATGNKRGRKTGAGIAAVVFPYTVQVLGDTVTKYLMGMN